MPRYAALRYAAMPAFSLSLTPDRFSIISLIMPCHYATFIATYDTLRRYFCIRLRCYCRCRSFDIIDIIIFLFAILIGDMLPPLVAAAAMPCLYAALRHYAMPLLMLSPFFAIRYDATLHYATRCHC